MSAELLRRAAALMRERAEAATPGPWSVGADSVWGAPPEESLVADFEWHAGPADPDAEHIASWHPTVALAVAYWLEMVAVFVEQPGDGAQPDNALAVARAYLGADA